MKKKASERGSVTTKAIIIQVAILVGLIALLEIVMPKIRKAQAAAEASKRESEIEGVFNTIVVEDSNAPSRSAPEYAGAPLRPQKLLSTPSIEDLKLKLGAADGFSGDFRGGVHMTWTGSNHRMEASFNHGQLYCLRLEDLHTGHGMLVFESGALWRAF